MKRIWRRASRDRSQPLRVMFIATELEVGGAERLLVEIVRNLDRNRFTPEVCCLKRPGALGRMLSREVTVHHGLLHSKYDMAVLPRLARCLAHRRIDAIVTVGTGGDRMFWGRLAGLTARVPVILSALHSTGYPQVVEPINRLLAPITDGFIAVAQRHAEYLVAEEGCPADRVYTIYNGVDTERFRPGDPVLARQRLGLPVTAPVCGIVAALRHEKQHLLLLDAFRLVATHLPDAHLVIVGDGPQRPAIEQAVGQWELGERVLLLGNRDDVPELLPAFDVKVLASKMEANPASVLEASACGVAVVAPAVGSLPETVVHERTGWLYPGSDVGALADGLTALLSDREVAARYGAAGRELVCRRFSLQAMVGGYERLIDGLWRAVAAGRSFRPADLAESSRPAGCAANDYSPADR